MKKSNNPIIYGEEARNIIKEITVIPSEKSKENGKKLVEYFNTLKDKTTSWHGEVDVRVGD